MTRYLVHKWIENALTAFRKTLPPSPRINFDMLGLRSAPYTNASIAAGAQVYFSIPNPASLPAGTFLNEDDFAVVNAFAGLPAGADISATVVVDSIDVFITNRTAAPIAVTNLVVNVLLFKKRP